jgi:hypothetical protein
MRLVSILAVLLACAILSNGLAWALDRAITYEQYKRGCWYWLADGSLYTCQGDPTPSGSHPMGRPELLP